MLTGSILFGRLSDRIGRRPTFLLCLACTGIFGASSALCRSLWTLMMTRVLCGLGVGGFHVSMTLFSEYIPKQTRAASLTLIQSFISIGSITTCALAWAFHTYSWRLLTVICASISILCAIPFYFLPESARFLVRRGEISKARAILTRIAKQNGRTLPDAFTIESPAFIRPAELPALFRNPTNRQLTIILCLLWYVAAFLYYGANFVSAQVVYGGNQNAKVLLISLAEIASLLNTFALSSRFGRRKAISICGAVECLVLGVLLLRQYIGAMGTVLAMFAFRGLAASFVAIVCMFTAEAFPTVLRSTGFGVVSAFSRVGGICTPWISIAFAAMKFELAIAVYLVVLLLGSLCAMALPFETRGRGMDES